MIIIMLGAPGRGKGTIGKKLCDEYSLEHVATGDIFRDEIKRGTECGIKANEFISQGKLVPDEITIEMVLNKLKKSKNVCLDGFPRTINQAEKLDEFLNNNNDKVTAVINLSVPDEDLIKRTSSRIICPNKSCGASYNTIFLPPKVEGVCDVCGTKLVKRPDDEVETIKHRIEVYYENTQPLISYYKNKGLLENIDINIYSETTMEDTTAKAVERINARNK